MKKDIEENGSGTGINHAGLDLEYHANVNVHGDTQITATGNVTLASTIDVTATSKAAAGPDMGTWVSGTNYTKGDVVTDPTTASGTPRRRTSSRARATTSTRAEPRPAR